MQFGRWKITNSLLVRRILDGAYKEFKGKNYNGPNFHRALRMFAMYALGSYLAYEAGKAGYKTAQKILLASTELFGTLVSAIPNLLDIASGNNPAEQSMRELLYSYQEMAAYIGIGTAPSKVIVRQGVEDTYIAAKANIDQFTGKNDIKDQLSTVKYQKSQAVVNFQDTYDKIQELVSGGDLDGAAKILDGLSAEDYQTYKRMKAARKAMQTKTAEQQMYPTVTKVQKMIRSGQTDEAAKIIDAMTDEEYRIYGLAKKQMGYR